MKTWDKLGTERDETKSFVVIIGKHFGITIPARRDDFANIFTGVFNELAAIRANSVSVVAL